MKNGILKITTKKKGGEWGQALHLTSGFTQAGVYSRRQFCADLEVYRPPEPLWNPRLREAATTLQAMPGHIPSRNRLTKFNLKP